MHQLDDEGRMPDRRVKLRRAYESARTGEGKRILVDRVWPRGLGKEALHLDHWLGEVAPSTELRKWFDHRADRWEEFRRRYTEELEARPETWAPLREAARRGDVVLLFGARDAEHNNAVVLRDHLRANG
jgi:uncharacterized protein YeaO (DUF488 family)